MLQGAITRFISGAFLENTFVANGFSFYSFSFIYRFDVLGKAFSAPSALSPTRLPPPSISTLWPVSLSFTLL
jgi:hypothetical protein